MSTSEARDIGPSSGGNKDGVGKDVPANSPHTDGNDGADTYSEEAQTPRRSPLDEPRDIEEQHGKTDEKAKSPKKLTETELDEQSATNSKCKDIPPVTAPRPPSTHPSADAPEMGTNQSFMQSAMDEAKAEVGGKAQVQSLVDMDMKECIRSTDKLGPVTDTNKSAPQENQGRELFKMLMEEQQKERLNQVKSPTDLDSVRTTPTFQPAAPAPKRQISQESSDLDEHPLVIAEGVSETERNIPVKLNQDSDNMSHLGPKKKFLKGLKRSQSDNNMAGTGSESLPESRSGSFSCPANSNRKPTSPAAEGRESKDVDKTQKSETGHSDGVNLRDYLHKIMETSIQNQLGRTSSPKSKFASPNSSGNSTSSGNSSPAGNKTQSGTEEVVSKTESLMGKMEALASRIPSTKSPSPSQQAKPVETDHSLASVTKEMKPDARQSYPIFCAAAAASRSEPPPLIKTQDLRHGCLVKPAAPVSPRGHQSVSPGFNHYSSPADSRTSVKTDRAMEIPHVTAVAPLGSTTHPHGSGHPLPHRSLSVPHGSTSIAPTYTHPYQAAESTAGGIKHPWPSPGYPPYFVSKDTRTEMGHSITHGRPITYGQNSLKENIKRETGHVAHQDLYPFHSESSGGRYHSQGQSRPTAVGQQSQNQVQSQSPHTSGLRNPPHLLPSHVQSVQSQLRHNAQGLPQHPVPQHPVPQHPVPQHPVLQHPASQSQNSAGTRTFRQPPSKDLQVGNSLGSAGQGLHDYKLSYSHGPGMQSPSTAAMYQKPIPGPGTGSGHNGPVTVSASVVWPPRGSAVMPSRPSPGTTRVRAEGSPGPYATSKHAHGTSQHHSAPPSPHQLSPGGQAELTLRRMPSPGHPYSSMSQMSPTGSQSRIHSHSDISRYTTPGKMYGGIPSQMLSPGSVPQVPLGYSGSRSQDPSPHRPYPEHSPKNSTPTSPHAQHGNHGGHTHRPSHEHRPTDAAYRGHLPETQPYKTHLTPTRSPAPSPSPSRPLSHSGQSTGNHSNTSSGEAPLDLSTKRKSSEGLSEQVSPRPAKAAKSETPLDLTVKKEEAVKPFTWRPAAAVVGPLVTQPSGSSEFPPPGVSTHIKSLETSMLKHIQTMQHTRAPYIPGYPGMPTSMQFAPRTVVSESAVPPSTNIYTRPPISPNTSALPRMPPPTGNSRSYGPNPSVTDSKMPTQYGKTLGPFPSSQTTKPTIRAEPYIVRPSVAPMRPNPPRPGPAGHAAENVTSVPSHTTVTATAATRATSGGNRMSITAMLLGNHPIDDILYLKCNVCNSPTSTYGSLHSYRKHFTKTHGFDPKPEHVTIRSISEAKDRGTRTGIPTVSGSTTVTPTIDSSVLPALGIAPIPLPEIRDHTNPALTPSPKPSRENTDRDSPKKPSSPSESSEDSSISDDKVKETIDPTGQSTMRCLQCGQDFPTRDWGVFKRHVRAHDFPQLRCNICRQTFQDADELKTHNNTYHQAQACVCRVCDVGFSHPGALSKHMKTAHQGQSPTEGEYRCMYCPLVFKQQQMWIAHLNDHERGVCVPRISSIGGSGLVRQATPDSTNEMEDRKPPVFVVPDEDLGSQWSGAQQASHSSSGAPAPSAPPAADPPTTPKDSKEPKDGHAPDDSETMTLGRTIFQIITEKVEQESRRQFAELEKARVEAQRLKSTEAQIQTEGNIPYSESRARLAGASQPRPSDNQPVTSSIPSERPTSGGTDRTKDTAESGGNVATAALSSSPQVPLSHPVHPKRKGYNPDQWAAKQFAEKKQVLRTSSSSPASVSSSTKDAIAFGKSSFVSAGEALDMLLKQAFMNTDPQDEDGKPQPILDRLKDPDSPKQSTSSSAPGSIQCNSYRTELQTSSGKTERKQSKNSSLSNVTDRPELKAEAIQPSGLSDGNSNKLDDDPVLPASHSNEGRHEQQNFLTHEDIAANFREKDKRLLTAEDYEGSTDTSIDEPPTKSSDDRHTRDSEINSSRETCTNNSTQNNNNQDPKTHNSSITSTEISGQTSVAEMDDKRRDEEHGSEKDQDAECADINQNARADDLNSTPAFRGDDQLGKSSSRSPLPSRKSTRPHIPPERFRFSQYETAMRGTKWDSTYRFSGESDSENEMNSERDYISKTAVVSKTDSEQGECLSYTDKDPSNNNINDTIKTSLQEQAALEQNVSVPACNNPNEEADAKCSQSQPEETKVNSVSSVGGSGNIQSVVGPVDSDSKDLGSEKAKDSQTGLRENLSDKNSLISKDSCSQPVCEMQVKELAVKPMDIDYTCDLDDRGHGNSGDNGLGSSSVAQAKAEQSEFVKSADESRDDIPATAALTKPRQIHDSRPSTPRSSQEDSSSDGMSNMRKKQTARKSMAACNEKQLSMLKRTHMDDLSSDDDQVSKRVRDCKVKLMDISHSPKYSDYVDVGKSRLPGDLTSTTSAEQIVQSEEMLICKDKGPALFSDKVPEDSGTRGTCTGYSSAPELPRRTRGRPRKHPLPGGATPPRQHSPASASDKETH